MVARAKPKKMYRTMQGRMVDIEKLRMANEGEQAVGNMKVNARGDVLGAGGKVVTSKETVIKKYYEQPKGKVSEGPAITKPAQQPQAVETKVVEPKKVSTPKVATARVAPKVAPKRTVAPKKGIDEALDGLE